MKILCSSNVEWFDSLDHNKISFFFVNSEPFFCFDRAGLRSLHRQWPSVLQSTPRCRIIHSSSSTFLLLWCSCSLCSCKHSMAGKKRKLFSPQKFFLRHVEVNFREWKMWKCWNIKSFSSLNWLQSKYFKLEISFLLFLVSGVYSTSTISPARQSYFSTFQFVEEKFFVCHHNYMHRIRLHRWCPRAGAKYFVNRKQEDLYLLKTATRGRRSSLNTFSSSQLTVEGKNVPRRWSIYCFFVSSDIKIHVAEKCVRKKKIERAVMSTENFLSSLMRHKVDE